MATYSKDFESLLTCDYDTAKQILSKENLFQLQLLTRIVKRTDIFKQLLIDIPKLIQFNLMDLAVQYNPELVTWLYDNGYGAYAKDPIEVLCRTNADNITMLKWLVEHGYKASKEAMHRATKNLEALKYLHSQGYELDEDMYSLIFFEISRSETASSQIASKSEISRSEISQISENKRLETMEWLFNNFCPIGKDILNNAISTNNLELILMIYDNFIVPLNEPIDKYIHGSSAFYNAIITGNLELLKWLYSKVPDKLPYAYYYDTEDAHPLYEAIALGWLDVVQFLHDKDYNTSDTLNEAVFFKQYEIISWAREHGYEYNDQTMINGIYTGNLAMIHYLYDTGCPCTEQTIKSAYSQSLVGRETTDSVAIYAFLKEKYDNLFTELK